MASRLAELGGLAGGAATGNSVSSSVRMALVVAWSAGLCGDNSVSISVRMLMRVKGQRPTNCRSLGTAGANIGVLAVEAVAR